MLTLILVFLYVAIGVVLGLDGIAHVIQTGRKPIPEITRKWIKPTVVVLLSVVIVLGWPYWLAESLYKKLKP